MADRQPNFLVFCVDQMRADHIGCMGNDIIRTPHLDGLAAEGVACRRAYVNNPLCMPGRATLFTGMTPRAHRVRTNGIPLEPRWPTVPQILSEAGYATASIGKIHLTPYQLHPNFEKTVTDPLDFPECEQYWNADRIDAVPTPYFGLDHVDLTIGHGCHTTGDYARWLRKTNPDAYAMMRSGRVKPSPRGSEQSGILPMDEKLHHTAYVADRTLDWLEGRDASKPFYLMCSFPDPHHPYHVPEAWAEMYDPDTIPIPPAREGELDGLAPFFRKIHDESIQLSGRGRATKLPDGHIQEILAYTYALVSQVDHHIGRVLAKLDAEGLTENTVVVFLSDHGDMMGDHELINKGPFHFEGLLRIPHIWRWPGRFAPRQTDGLASLLDFAPTVLDLADVAYPEGPASPEAPAQPPALPGRSLKPLLQGETESVQDSVVVENDEDYLGLRLRTLVTATHKITTYTGHRGPEPYGELFDLAADPHELHNLWDTDPALRQALIEQLHHRLVETDCALPRRLSHA